MAKPRDTDTLSLGSAARQVGLSVVTLRKYVTSGELPATKTQGRHGNTWAIARVDLEAFTRKRFPGRDLVADPDNRERPDPDNRESAVELRRRLDDTLVELGRYRALTEKAESASADVERLLKERIAELQAERDVARDELQRLRGRGFWGRLFGGSGGAA